MSDETVLAAFDLETHLIQPGLLTPPIVVGSRCRRFEGKLLSNLFTKEDVEIFCRNAADRADKTGEIVVGANIAYDFGCVLAEWPELFPYIWNLYERGCVMDVLIAAGLNAIAEGRMKEGDLYRRDGSKIQSGRYSLDECVSEWLGRKDAKARDRWRESYALLEGIPFEEWPYDAKQYPIDDVENTLLVAEKQLESAKNLGDLPAQCHAAFCIHLGSIWGLRTDPVAVGEMAKNVEGHLEELRAWAVEMGLMKHKTRGRGANKYNVGVTKDTKVLKELVFKAYNGLPPGTEGGDTSLSRETLEDSGDATLEKFAEVGKWEKFNTYVPTLKLASTMPLTVKSNVLLSTGRTSYEGLIQLMPRKGGVRECFIARDGHAWSSVDYAAIEMSTLGQVCLWAVGFSDLADAINRDMDPHSILGADLLGCGYEDFYKRRKEETEKLIRQAAKAGNFGFPGMMSEPTFVAAKRREGESVCEWFFHDGRCGEEKLQEWKGRTLDAPQCVRCCEQAKIIRAGFLGRWSEINPYWDWVSDELSQNDAVTQFVSERVRGSPTGPAAANTLFQGLAADGAKRAVVAMTREMYMKGTALEMALYKADREKVLEELRSRFGSDLESPLYGSRLCIFAHDETILEIPEAVGHEAAHRQAEVMVDEMRTCVPDVKVKAEPALMRRWYKAAEAVYDANKRLIPWEPERKAA